MKNALRILVVEDEIPVARDLAATLTRQGFQVMDICHTGEQALESVRREVPDVVLLDIRLGPGMDGVRTAEKLRFLADVPVIFLTGYSDQETVTRAGGVEPFGYLLKPFQEDGLRSAVELAHARHSTQAALRTSGDQLAATLRSMGDGVISTNLLGAVTFMNPVAETLTGWTAAEAAGRPLSGVFRVCVPGGGALEPSGLMLPASRSGGPGPRTILLTDRAGRTFPIEDRTTPVRDADGALTGIVILFRRRPAVPASGHFPVPDPDLLTDPQASQTANPQPLVPESLNSLPWPDLTGMVGSIADPLLAVNADWNLTWLNAEAAQILGGTPENLMGGVLWDLLPPSLHRLHYHDFSTALTKGAAAAFEMEHSARGLWFGVRLYPFEGGLLVLLRDITARRRSEEERGKVEKLENLGLLARGFAHDFNNLLTVLLGNLSLAEERLAGLPQAPAEELRTARQATLQAQNLVQQLLIFARGGAPIRQLTDPGRLVNGWFADWPGRADVEYRVSAPEETWRIAWDGHQIRRVLANLMKNAENALTGPDARITIGLKRTTLPAGAPSSADAVPWLVLEVSDNGCGMDPETLRQAAEPYFSTRGGENATGLGLTVCEAITRAHGGSFDLSSEAGRGTVARAVFPLPDKSEPPESSPKNPSGNSGGQSSFHTLTQQDRAVPPPAPKGQNPRAGGNAFGNPAVPSPAPKGQNPIARGNAPGNQVVPSPAPKGQNPIAWGNAPGIPHQHHGALKGRHPEAPTSQAGHTPVTAPAPRPDVDGKSSRRVLLLEDEPQIRLLLSRLLEALGCTVTNTAEGSQTVRVYTENFRAGQRFDLVIMDLSIPGGMGGAQAMEEIRQIDPGVCAIVSSGYSDDPVMARHADYGFRAVLPKPWQPADLQELVSRLLTQE